MKIKCACNEIESWLQMRGRLKCFRILIEIFIFFFLYFPMSRDDEKILKSHLLLGIAKIHENNIYRDTSLRYININRQRTCYRTNLPIIKLSFPKHM